MKLTRVQSIGVIAVSGVLGLSIGGGAVALASQPTSAVSSTKVVDPSAVPAEELTPDWRENSFGLEVGTPTEGDRITQNLPDLTPTKADNGKEGFIRSSDFYYPNPTTPAEAVAQTKQRLNDKNQLVLNVYGPDGETLIGTQLVAEVTMESTAK